MYNEPIFKNYFITCWCSSHLITILWASFVIMRALFSCLLLGLNRHDQKYLFIIHQNYYFINKIIHQSSGLFHCLQKVFLSYNPIEINWSKMFRLKGESSYMRIWACDDLFYALIAGSIMLWSMIKVRKEGNSKWTDYECHTRTRTRTWYFLTLGTDSGADSCCMSHARTRASLITSLTDTVKLWTGVSVGVMNLTSYISG